MNTQTEDLCTIGFRSEAYDSAADALRRCVGWTMTVHPTREGDGESFDGTLRRLDVDHDNGEWVAVLALWSGDDEPTPETPLRRVFLYGTQFEVI
jgi:hypothetical protein